MRKFFLCKHDYSKNSSFIVTAFESIKNARLMLEEILDDIQTLIQGNVKYTTSNSISKINTLRYGMFVLTYNQIADRYTVIKRNRSEGFLYNSYNDELYCDLFIVTQSVPNNIDWFEVTCEPTLEFENNYDKVMKQLIEYNKIADYLE